MAHLESYIQAIGSRRVLLLSLPGFSVSAKDRSGQPTSGHVLYAFLTHLMVGGYLLYTIVFFRYHVLVFSFKTIIIQAMSGEICLRFVQPCAG
jgi:hypothetical protein